MHPKYHWPISRQKYYGADKKILFKKPLFDLEVKDQGPTKVITVRDTPPYGHAHTNYLPMNSFVGFIWIIWPWGQRSRSHEGHCGTWHTALWSCTHIPIIIDLERQCTACLAEKHQIPILVWPDCYSNRQYFTAF
jgi:hypothetical protein